MFPVVQSHFNRELNTPPFKMGLGSCRQVMTLIWLQPKDDMFSDDLIFLLFPFLI